MTTDRLLANFDRIADSPDAVQRLRRFILELAVRGKLVEQDPNDQPASELLKRIVQEKAQLVKEGSIKNPKKLQAVGSVDAESYIPSSWCWTRLGEVTSYIQRGKSPKYATADGFPVVSQKCVQWHGLNLNEARQITYQSLATYEDIRFLREGDLLWNSTGTGTIGRIIRISDPPERLVCDSHVTVVRCLIVSSEYIRTWLRSGNVHDLIEERAVGSTKQVELTAQMALNQSVPLPPLAEQHRIVAKVDELMALCDRLEAVRAGREATRERLAAASLARLNAPDPDPATFRDHAAFALDNLAPLTTRGDQIKALGQTVLNLAVRGKLVAQDRTESRDNQGHIRADALAEKFDAQAFADRAALFSKPVNWTVEALSRVASHIVDCPHTTPKWTDEGVLCIKTNQVRAGRLDLSSPYFVSEEAYKSRISRLEPKPGDVLYIREGGILGVACRVPRHTRLCLGQRLMLIRVNDTVTPRFLEFCLNSPWITEFAIEKTTGGAAPRVNMSIVRSYPIPVPPLSEQHRIVNIVDKLMTICDRLEDRVATVDDTRCRLLDALLYEALEPATDQDGHRMTVAAVSS